MFEMLVFAINTKRKKERKEKKEENKKVTKGIEEKKLRK